MQPDPVDSTKMKLPISLVRAAEYVKQHLFSNLIKHPKFITDTKAAIAETYNLTDSEFLLITKNSVSRAFGDKVLKQYFVADPEMNTNTKCNHVRKDILMLSTAHNGGSRSEGINYALSGSNNYYRETDSAYNDMPEVILDNQAQVNCTGNFNVLSNLCIGPENVVLIAANGGEMETFMSGSVHVGNYILHDVHYCPDLGNRIIVSGSKLDKDDYGYEFGQGKFTVKDLKNDTTVGEGRLVDDNYILEYLKISGNRTRVPQQPGLVTTVWNAVCSALHRLGLRY